MSSPRTLSARTAAATVTGQFAGRGVTLLLTVATTAVVTRAIGTDGFADWGTVLMLVALTSFALDPGIAPVVVRRLVQADESAPAPAALLLPRLALALLAYAVVVAVTLALRGGDALLLALVLGAQLLPRAVVMNAGTWLQAEHRLHLQTGYEALTAAVGLALLVALAAADASAAALAAAGVVGPALLLAGLMQRELGRLSLGPSGGPGRVAAVLREAAPLAGALVLVSVYTRIGIVFVNEGASSAEVADFSLAFLFVEQAIVVAGILGAALLPMLAVRAARLSAGEDALAADLLLSMTLAGTATGVGLVAFADPLVALLGGDEFGGAVEILRLLAPACAAIFANFFVGYLFVALQRARLYLWFNLAGLVVSVALGLTLTLDGGAPAAARVTWITELVVVSIAVVPFLGRRPAGLRAMIAAGGLMAVSVLCAELVAADTASPWLACPLAALVAAGLGGSAALRLARHLRGGMASTRS